MDISQVDFIIDSYGVANQVGLAEVTIRKNYINNKTKDKSSLIKAMGMGTFCMQNDISPKELKFIVTNYLKVKEFYGKLS